MLFNVPFLIKKCYDAFQCALFNQEMLNQAQIDFQASIENLLSIDNSQRNLALNESAVRNDGWFSAEAVCLAVQKYTQFKLELLSIELLSGYQKAVPVGCWIIYLNAHVIALRKFWSDGNLWLLDSLNSQPRIDNNFFANVWKSS